MTPPPKRLPLWLTDGLYWLTLMISVAIAVAIILKRAKLTPTELPTRSLRSAPFQDLG